MANWCENQLTIEGPAPALADFRKNTVGHNLPILTSIYVDTALGVHDYPTWTELDVENVLPIPKALDPESYGNWMRTHWGASWPRHVQVCSDGPTHRVLIFDTAWDAPEAWVRYAASRWPMLEFELLFSETGMNFSGIVKFSKGVQVLKEVGEYGESHGIFFDEDNEDDGS
jgi:hypothetical protein